MVKLNRILLSKLAGLTLLSCMSVINPVVANEGMTAFNRKDYNEAYRIWRRTPNSLESMYGIGRLNFEGLGGPQNTSKGLSLIDQASSGGYSPASEYLASHYEARRDFKGAVKYLERLAAKGPSLTVQKRLVNAYSNTESRPITGSVKYCGALKTLVEMDSSTDLKKDMQACALAGRPSTISRQVALEGIGSTLSQTPTIESLEKVSATFLDPSSPLFNPVVIEQAVWVLDKNIKNSRIKEVLISAGVSFDRCSDLPAQTQEDKKTFNAYCTLAAIAGDSRPVKLMALNYAHGKDGRSVDLSRAAALIDLSSEMSKSKEGVLIKLYSYLAEAKWKEHLSAMEAAGTILFELPTADLINQFAFQLDASSSREYGQKDAGRLLALANVVTQPDIQIAAFEQLKNKPKQNDFTPDDKDFISNLCALEVKTIGAEKVCRNPQKGQPDSKAILIKQASSFVSGKEVRPPDNSSPGPTPRSSTVEVPVDQSLIQCDSGILDSCAIAAKALLSRFPPRGYETISESERTKLALNRLERAADAGVVSSLAMIYDIYSQDLDSRLKEKAKRYLSALIQKGTSEGRLREQLDILNVDPISGILGAVLERTKYKRACTSIQLLLTRRELSREDEVKAIVALDGALCNAVK